MIAFNEAAHTYTNVNTQKQYLSVTTLIGKFKPPFDEPYWSVYTAIRLEKGMEKKDFSRYLMQKHQFNFGAPKFISVLYKIAEIEGILQQVLLRTSEIKDQWHVIKTDACEKGTAFHIHKENEAYDAGVMKTNARDITNKVAQIIESKAVFVTPDTRTTGPNGGGDVLKVSAKELYLLPDGYYPELIIWNDQYGICGTADKVWINTIDGIRFIDIDDWKTNKEIKMPDRYCMLKPLEHLSDVNYIHYSLQLSTYAWMLEEVGFTIRNLYLTHQRSVDETPTRYKLKYLKKEVLLMMKHKK